MTDTLQSGASSSVVVMQPAGAVDSGGNPVSDAAAGATPGMSEARRGTIVGSALVACCLIAAIMWLPRRLNAR